MKLILARAAALAVGAPQDVTKGKAKKLAPAAVAQDADAKGAEAKVVTDQLPSYPLDTCVISGKELGSMGDAIDHVVNGRLVRLCCEGCIKRVDADPAASVAKVNAAVIRTQMADYPLEACPLSGEALDAESIDHVVGTRLVRVCCKRCVAALDKDASKAMDKVDTAYIAAQRPTYPVKTCVISNEELGSMGEPIDMLYGTRLVRLCCKGCKKEFAKDPKVALAKLDVAAKATEAKADVKKEIKRAGGQ